VLIFALMLAIYLKKAPATYQETATVVFIGPIKAPNPYAIFKGDLVATGYVVMQALTSPASEEAIRQAGGSASYSAGLTNGYNLEYPVYGKPYGTLTTVSSRSYAVQRTFVLVSQQLSRLLAAGQENVPPGARIVPRFVGDTGPIAVRGSSKRVYAGELLLCIIALFIIVGLVDRLPGGRAWVTRVRRLASGN
jgi:hypothetical protein